MYKDSQQIPFITFTLKKNDVDYTNICFIVSGVLLHLVQPSYFSHYTPVNTLGELVI